MDLPASIIGLGEQLRGCGEIAPDPALLSDPQVFAAERERIFQRSVVALDHEMRLAEDGRWFRCDAAPRSLLVTREAGGRLHALRNVCIHAGYPVCEAEEGIGERLMCPYHGWEYALDGRLVEPELSSRIDPPRLRLPSYPVRTLNGLIVVDPVGPSAADPASAISVPAWLTAAGVTQRMQLKTNRNWKFLRQFVQSSPQFFFDDAPDGCHPIGPLGFLFTQSRRAVLIRIVPKFAEQTDMDAIEMAADEMPASARFATCSDAVAKQLGGAEPATSWFGRDFAEWYWTLMSAEV
jgi:nitrite reductase/ring-hydroxylating ferredoxin subunit